MAANKVLPSKTWRNPSRPRSVSLASTSPVILHSTGRVCCGAIAFPARAKPTLSLKRKAIFPSPSCILHEPFHGQQPTEIFLSGPLPFLQTVASVARTNGSAPPVRAGFSTAPEAALEAGTLNYLMRSHREWKVNSVLRASISCRNSDQGRYHRRSLG